MSVKFTPGPHPTSVSRQNSANLFLNPPPSNPNSNSNSPFTVSFPRAGDRSHLGPKSPYPAHLLENASPVPSAGPTPTSENFAPGIGGRGSSFIGNETVNRNGNETSLDLERQPLLPTRELNRPRIMWSVLIAILVLIFFGVVVGFGGWRLGKGAGGGRWPGSPGMTAMRR